MDLYITYALSHPDDLSLALISAVSRGYLSIVRLFLNRRAPITDTTATCASRDGKPNGTTRAIFESFLQHGWSIQSTTGRDETIIMSLITSNTDSESLLQWFLDNGAPPNGLPSDPSQPLRWAVMGASSPAIPSLLISHGATVKHTSALHTATYRRGDEASIAIMECLLKAGIDINELEYEGQDKLPRSACHKDWGTALHTAAKEGSVPRARMLVENGVDLGKKSRQGYTARDRAQISEKENVKIYLEAVIRERGIEFTDSEIKEEGSKDED